MKNQSPITKRKMIYADLALFLVAIVWGTGFSALKSALNNMTPFYLLAIRFTLAALIMGLILIKKLKHITKQDLRAGAIIGIFLFIGFALQTTGLQYTDAGKQAFLTGSNVIIVPFLAWMVHKKRPDTYSFVATFFTMTGIALLTLNGKQFIMNKGDILSLASAVLYASQIVSIGYFSKNRNPMLLAFIQISVMASFFIGAALIFEPIPTNAFSREVMWPIAYMVLFPTVFAFFTQNMAQSMTTSTRAALILSSETVFGLLTAVIFLKEVFTTQMIFGCVLIFTGIIIAETKLSFLKFKKASLNES